MPGVILPHHESVRFAAFSPDGTRVLTATSFTAQLWEVTGTAGKAEFVWTPGAQIYHAAFSPDGTYVPTASVDHLARLWDVKTGKEAAALPHPRDVRYAAFSRAGKMLLTIIGSSLEFSVCIRYLVVMSRPLRITFPGALYHLTSRGNAQAAIYADDADRRAFVDLLTQPVQRYHWLCHSYCLMDNHYHLLIETPERNLSQGASKLHGVYTQEKRKKGAGLDLSLFTCPSPWRDSASLLSQLFKGER